MMIRSVFMLTALTIPALIGACSGGDAGPLNLTRATSEGVPGRWDDFNAALSTAQREHEMAVLEQREPGPGVREYVLLTILDERVVIRAEAPETDRYAPTDFNISVAHGVRGDEAKERAIIQTLRRRLEQLAQRAR